MTSDKSINEFTEEYFFLSNFYHFPIVYKDKTFVSTEAAYQWAKTEDPEYQHLIQQCASSAMSKKLGKMCPLRSDWNKIKLEAMRELVYIKFVNTELTQKLIDTGDAVLIEGNWWKDTYWGVYEGKGKNMLGKLLMEVRDFVNEKTVIQTAD